MGRTIIYPKLRTNNNLSDICNSVLVMDIVNIVKSHSIRFHFPIALRHRKQYVALLLLRLAVI